MKKKGKMNDSRAISCFVCDDVFLDQKFSLAKEMSTICLSYGPKYTLDMIANALMCGY